MESLKHKLPSDVEEEDAFPEVKRVRPAADLPPEMWELIFRNLNAYWLRSARLTCSSWNQIIRGSSRLMAKFVLTLTTDNFKEDRKLVRKLLATGSGYTRAKLEFEQIGIHKPRENWLKPLGTTLRTLSVKFSGTEVLLTGLLKELPNLKQLKLIVRSHWFGSGVPSIRLDKLEELSINHPMPNILSFCRLMCPQLTVLKLNDYISYRPDLEKEIVAFINSTRRTLKELQFHLPERMIDDLVRIKELRLARLAVDGWGRDTLRFVEQQPNLEELNLLCVISIQNLNEIISVLSKLKNLRVVISEQGNHQPSLSLRKLSNIESLKISHGHWLIPTKELLILTGCNLTNLRDLSLSRCHLSSQVLTDLQGTNVSRLTLEFCSLPRLSDLARLKSLIHVELNENEYFSRSDDVDSTSSSVRSLKIVDADPRDLLAVVKVFPNLERFEAAGITYVDEAVFEMMSQHSPLVKELRFGKRCFFNIRTAVARLRALKTISIQRSDYESEDYAEQLRAESSNVALEFW
ncbi:uncharacterized protein LOC120428718 [Culex pipiens pallens]|uniref:uncharacterized protein LOC120428718 n=1 Tax=Culex pipiens pallens TaxID=42434 RepID=UPI0019543392|nr:uncharacterized protein LOC120428718 [Culex pipiens pallens]